MLIEANFSGNTKPALREQLSAGGISNSSFSSITRIRKQWRKISRVKQQVMTEKYIKSINENARNDSKHKTERVKLLNFLWKDVKSRETDNISMTLEYDEVELAELDPEGLYSSTQFSSTTSTSPRHYCVTTHQ